MKTLVKNNVSFMLIEDDEIVVVGEKHVEIGFPVRITIDNSEGLIKLYKNVTPPDNYVGKRFCFDGSEWTINYDWRNPNLTAVKR
jgi:hypothetical protein